jgi:hypothetical protein
VSQQRHQQSSGLSFVVLIKLSSALVMPPTSCNSQPKQEFMIFSTLCNKKFEGAAPTKMVPLPNILSGKVLPTPAKVVKARLNRGVWELLVQWEGRAVSDASWEQLEEFKRALSSSMAHGRAACWRGGKCY